MQPVFDPSLPPRLFLPSSHLGTELKQMSVAWAVSWWEAPRGCGQDLPELSSAT